MKEWKEFWQEIKENGRLSDHISIKEYRCHHCNRLPIDDPEYLGNYLPYTSILDALEELIDSFERLREKMGMPIPITSGYRCRKHQEELIRQGYKAALVSPHNFGVALDIRFNTIELNEMAYNLLDNEINPDLRIGFHKYNKEIIHIDTAYQLILSDEIIKIIGVDEYHKLYHYYHPGARW